MKNMNPKIILLMVQLMIIMWKVSGDDCTIENDDSCISYTVVCLNGIDSLESECEDAAVTFVLTNFSSYVLSSSIFSNTDGSFDPMVQIIKGVNNMWTTLGPSLFTYYGNTIKVDLSGNHIKLISDMTFRGLLALENLNLSRNSIETLSNNSLSIGESENSRINIIDLSNNNITFIAPATFQSLPVLRKLYLDNNKIDSSDNITLVNIDNMDYLSLHNNKLTSLNNLLNHASSLTILDLSQNHLTHLYAHEIMYLRSIQIFNVSWNSIETVDIDCFDQTPFIKTLDLSNNKIKSAIGTIMFLKNNRLEYLNIYNNSITEIQRNAFINTKLSYLNLEGNYLNGVVGEYTFAGLQSTKLNFSNFKIEIIKNYAFFNSSNLVYLNLNRNIITTIEDHGIESLPSLKILDLSHNSISNINFLQQCCFNLIELYLKDNKLESLQSDILYNYMFIKIFDISMNNIAVLAQNSLPLNSLQYFRLKDNLLQGAIESNIFNPSLYMMTLDLSNMTLSAIHSGAFNNLPSLIRLNISHNQITFIDSNNFIGLEDLLILDLSYNLIKSMNIKNSVLKNLNSIYLNHNNFITLSGLVSHCNNLIHLDVSYNQLDDISIELSQKLKTLYLSHNKIQSFNNQHTNKLKKLVDLKLSYNKLSNLNLSFFPELEILEVSNVSLKNINRQFMQKLKKLKYLDLSNNDIADFPPGIFHEINGIKYFNISSNNLVNLRFGSFNDLPRVELLDISRNNLKELDINLFHECTSLNKLIIDHNRITKLNVEGLVEILPNLKTISLGGNAFSCAEVIQSLKTFNHSSVYVTSIQKVYHDDNIHGIKCETESEIATTNKPTLNIITNAPTFEPEHNEIEHVTHPNIIHVQSSHREYTALTAWCSILTILMLMIVFVFGYYYNRKLKNNISETFDYRRASSVGMNGRDHNVYLLS